MAEEYRKYGQFVFAANLEVQKDQPLDTRIVVTSVDALKKSETWESKDGTRYLYDGLVVAVTTEKALYMLVDKTKYNQDAGWKRLDAEAAQQIDLVDNLDSSTATDKALTAKQGFVLKSLIDDVSGNLSTLDSSVSALDSSVESIESSIEDLDSSLSALETKLDSSLGELEETLAGAISDLSSVYRFKGTKETYDELPDEDENEVGDVYNVEGEGPNGEAPGTNYVWDGEDWDALAGIVDLSAYALKTDVSTLESTVNTIKSDVSTLKTDVSTLNSSINAHESRISTLESFITDDESGKNLGELLSDIESTILATIGDTYVQKTTYTTKVGEIDSSISALDSSIKSLDASITDINSKLPTFALKTDVSTLESKVSANTANIELLNKDENTAGSILNIVKEDGYIKEDALTTINSSIGKLETSVGSLTDLTSNHATKITNIEQALTWQSLPQNN